MLAGDCFIVILPQSSIFSLSGFFLCLLEMAKYIYSTIKKQLAFLLSLTKAMTYFG